MVQKFANKDPNQIPFTASLGQEKNNKNVTNCFHLKGPIYTQYLKMKVIFPPNHKFRKLWLEKRGPIPIIKHIKSAKNFTELQKNFSEISNKDRKRICEKNK